MQHLSGVSFRGGDRLFASGVNQQSFVGDCGKRRIGEISDAEREGAGLFSPLQNLIDVRASPDCDTPITSARFNFNRAL
jgi:hypothetical protein